MNCQTRIRPCRRSRSQETSGRLVGTVFYARTPLNRKRSKSSWLASGRRWSSRIPPYNVPIEGHASRHGSAKHFDFAMASGEMSEAEFIAFLRKVLALLAAHSKDGALHFVCMDWRHLFELLPPAGAFTTSSRTSACGQRQMGEWARSTAHSMN